MLKPGIKDAEPLAEPDPLLGGAGNGFAGSSRQFCCCFANHQGEDYNRSSSLYETGACGVNLEYNPSQG